MKLTTGQALKTEPYYEPQQQAEHSSKEVLVSLQQVSKYYQLGDIKVTALNNVSLKLYANDLVVVYGPSGSGKSTLMNMISLTDGADSGVVEILGSDIKQLNDSQQAEFRNKNIGFIFQNFNLIPMFSALENVMLPLLIAKVSKADARKKALDILAQVGLADKASARPNQLSGGQQQRVAIARALVNKPKLVVADEPTANLDSRSSENIINLMRSLNREFNTSFIISTHDVRVLNQIDHKIQLVDGNVVEGDK
jgi:putative ABC transport system ATP-binding protein